MWGPKFEDMLKEYYFLNFKILEKFSLKLKHRKFKKNKIICKFIYFSKIHDFPFMVYLFLPQITIYLLYYPNPKHPSQAPS